ncbi:MAG: hypothetical protein U1E15_09720 [Hyphomicrobiales bacterium]
MPAPTPAISAAPSTPASRMAVRFKGRARTSALICAHTSDAAPPPEW